MPGDDAGEYDVADRIAAGFSAACVRGVVDRGEVFLVAAAGVLDVGESGVAVAHAGGDHVAAPAGRLIVTGFPRRCRCRCRSRARSHARLPRSRRSRRCHRWRGQDRRRRQASAAFRLRAGRCAEAVGGRVELAEIDAVSARREQGPGPRCRAGRSCHPRDRRQRGSGPLRRRRPARSSWCSTRPVSAGLRVCRSRRRSRRFVAAGGAARSADRRFR